MAKQIINAFAAEIANAEGGKSQANLGDTKQILKIANGLLGGKVYAAIKERDANKGTPGTPAPESEGIGDAEGEGEFENMEG